MARTPSSPDRQAVADTLNELFQQVGRGERDLAHAEALIDGLLGQQAVDRLTFDRLEQQHANDSAEREEIAQRLARSEERLERAVRRAQQAEAQLLVATAHDQQWEAARQRIREQEEDIAGLQTIMRDQSARITELQETASGLRLRAEEARTQRLVADGLLEMLHACQHQLQEADDRAATAEAANTRLTAANQDVYVDRNLLVQLCACLAKRAGWRAYWVFDPEEPGWPVLAIDTPRGQVSWHLPVAVQERAVGVGAWSDVGTWDGHTTEEKRERIRALLGDIPAGAPASPAGDTVVRNDPSLRYHAQCPARDIHVVATTQEGAVAMLRQLLA